MQKLINPCFWKVYWQKLRFY